MMTGGSLIKKASESQAANKQQYVKGSNEKGRVGGEQLGNLATYH
jgi:hypothetical protein